mmetsp:Transcript_5402/g.12267  ORF Transcript_5402/g.12267 Transcript_5402/m.12267 type:complete len:800 (-) Transcript_5402:267-2666(-)
MVAKHMQQEVETRCSLRASPHPFKILGGEHLGVSSCVDTDVGDIHPQQELAACRGICVLHGEKKCLRQPDPCRLSPKIEAGTRPYSTQERRMRRRKNSILVGTRSRHEGRILWRPIFAFSLFLLTLNIIIQPILMVDAKAEDDNIDAIDTTKEMVDGDEHVDGKGEGVTIETDADFPTEDSLPLPTKKSLIKATMVGAKIREVQNPQDGTEKSLDDASKESEMTSPNANHVDDVPRNPKPSLTGCHWGEKGCQKGKRNAGASEVNSSSVETNADDITQGGGDGINSPPSSSSLAGSATAKIEARVTKGRRPTLSQRRPATSPPEWDRDNTDLNSKETHGTDKPPFQDGFKLAGRIVTSPSDGLSYFLDAPQVDPEDNGGDWMMTIPYAYLDCGPTIESTTEAFSLADMVLRHFPASASMGHWTNLGGGVTIENDMNEEEETEGPNTKYIDGSHEGQPKLLVALSPIEITVSGNNDESRLFNPGDVILMEDTLGKGHKMSAAHGNTESSKTQDMSVLMISLPHTVHFPVYDWLEESSYLHDSDSLKESSTSTMQSSSSSASPPTSYGAENALFGFAPKHLHHKHRRLRRLRKRSSFTGIAKKPCPLVYDSAYSSLFMPTHNQYRKHRRSRRHPRWRENQSSKDPSFDESHPPPPGFSTYERDSKLFHYLPSLRRTMLFGLGISLTSSFIYCVQLLFPPLLALWGGATMVFGGALMNVLVTRWSYRRFVANWEEEWRWKREVQRNKMYREELTKQQEDITNGDNAAQSNADANDEATNNHFSNDAESVKETDMGENVSTAL